tara:strand:+ start:458 stop:1021 length:564 start_codon:yes stop_codon:yes gene_type:complete
MATLTPTLTIASTDALSDAISFSVTDSLSVLGSVKRISYSLTTSSQDILTASSYNKSYVFMQNKSTTASEIITIGKKSTDATVDTSNTDATITMDSTANISVGMSITGTNIQSATTIASITNTTTAEMSKTATGTASNITATFGTEDFITLGAEEFAFFPWSGTENLDALSADGTPTLEVMIFEATA